MTINTLKARPAIDDQHKQAEAYAQFGALLEALRTRELSDSFIAELNTQIEQLNTMPDTTVPLRKQLRKTQSNVLKRLEQDFKIVTKQHYRKTWLALGMAVFGIPLGVAFGTALKNMAFLGIGLPIGLVIGMAVGTGLDKKALEEGRQLDIEITY